MPDRRFQQQAREVLRHPGAFSLRVLKAFRANQGLLLAGAVAYYALLSIIPLLILLIIALSHFIDRTRLLATLSEYLQFIVPGQSDVLVEELRIFLRHRDTVSGALLLTMIPFSALAFTVLENAMSVIFFHRVKVRRRHFMTSAVMPYLFILFLGLGLMLVTFVAGMLALLATHNVTVFGVPHSLQGLADWLLYFLGVLCEILILTAIYLVMPVGRLSFRHALIGGVSAGLLWEITRHVLVWYYSTMSQVRLVYGSFATAIAVLLSVEISAIVLLLGAQVIAEYERLGREAADLPPKPMDLDASAGKAPPPSSS
jgi:membrane protein